MPRISRQRLRGLTAAVVTLVVTSLVVWLAIQADGRPLSDANSNDGGAWLASRSTGEVLNIEQSSREVRSSVAAFDAGAASSTMVVRQSDTVTLAHDVGSGVVKVLDPALAQVTNTTLVPPGVTVTASKNAVVIFDQESQRVWVATSADFKQAEDIVEDGLPSEAASMIAVEVNGGPVVLSAEGSVSRPLESTDHVQLDEIPAPNHMALAGELAVFEVNGTWVVASRSDARTIRTGAPSAVFVQQPGERRNWIAFVAGGSTEHLYLLNIEYGQTVSVGDVDGVTTDLLFHDSCVHRLARVADDLVRSATCVDLTAIPTNGGDSVVAPSSFDEEAFQPGVDAELQLVNGFVWVDTFDGQGFVFDEPAYAQVEPDSTPVPEVRAEPNPDEVEDEVGGDDNADATKECEDTDPTQQEAPVAVSDNNAGTDSADGSTTTQFATRLGRPVVIDVLRNDFDPDCDVLFIVDATLTAGQGATLQISPSRDAIQVMPGPLPGRIELTYEISDGTSTATDSAAAVVEVKEDDRAGNLAPVTRPDRLVSSASSVVRVNVLQNDVDPDGDSLRLVAVGDPGSSATDPTVPQILASHPNGDLVIALPTGLADDNAEVTVGYVVSDEWGDTSTGEVLLTVRLEASNYQPNARNDGAITRVGQQVVFNLLDNDVDGDGDPLRIARNAELVSGPEGANYSTTAAGEFTFETAAEPGTYLFEYSVTDGNLSDTAKVRIDVSPAEENSVPAALRDDVVLAVGETRLIRVFENDGDPDGDVVGIATIQPNPNVSVEIIDGFGFLVTLKPSAGRLETFSYTISDGRRDPETGAVLTSAPAFVAVTRSDDPFQNGPPIALDDSVRVRPGRVSFIRVLDNDFDPEGHRISLTTEDGVSLDVQGAEGATEGIRAIGSSDGQIVQLDVPAETELPFAFSYSVQDDAGSEPASATVRVSLVGETEENTPPIARIDREIVRPGQTIDIPVLSNDSDRESDALSLTGALKLLPSHGTVEILEDEGIIKYTAAPDFGGTDRFTYTVRDSEGAESVGLVEVGVLPVSRENNPPVAAPDLDYELFAGSGTVFLDVLANDSDFDGDALSIIDVSPFEFGQSGAEGQSAIVIAEAGAGIQISVPEQVDEVVEIALQYQISDGRGGTASAEILVIVRPDENNVAPVAEPDSVGPVKAGDIVTVDVLANDFDPDSSPNSTESGRRLDLTLVAEGPGTRVAGPEDGPQLLEITAPAESAEVAYSVRDNDGLLASSFVTVIVEQNLPPVIQEEIVLPVGPDAELAGGETLEVNLADYVTDPDDDPLTFLNIGAQVGGTTTLSDVEGDGLVFFTASPEFAGEGSFSFSVRDGTHEVAGLVTIRLSGPPNRPPEPLDVALSIEAGVSQPFAISALFFDPDQDPLTFTISVPPSADLQMFGVNSVGATDNETITLAADRASEGVDNVPFTVTASDGEFSADAVVSVQVLPAAIDPPTAQSDEIRTTQGVATSIDPRANDVDPFGDGLTVVSAVALSGGAASHDTEEVTFTPDDGFFGTATIQYEIQDPREGDLGRAQGVISVAVIGRPAVAQQVEAEATGPSSVNLTWRAPDNNGGPIDLYMVRIRRAGGAFEDVEYVGENPQFAFDDLEPGVEYDFQVHAHNEAGDAEWSQWSNVVVPDQVPAAPARPEVSFLDVDPGQIRISWNEPANTGSDIQTYVVTASGACLADEAIAETEVSAADLELVWDGLADGERCAFTVEAQNLAVTERGEDALVSPPSDSICPVAVPSAPGAPTVARGDEQAVVNWAVPANPDCEPLIGYELQRLRNGVPDGSPLAVPFGTLSDTSAPLANGDEYSFQVRAQNRRDWGPWGSLSSPVVPCREPDAPPAPTVVRDDGSATITRVGDAVSNGCSIEQYEVRIAPDGQPVAFTSDSQLYSDLTNGTEYQFQLRAINEIGEGPWSEASDPVVPAGQPFPGVLTIAAGTYDPRVPSLENTLLWQVDFPDPNNGTAMTDITMTGNVESFISEPSLLPPPPPSGATGLGSQELPSGTGKAYCVNAQGNRCIPDGGLPIPFEPMEECFQQAQDVSATVQGSTEVGLSPPTTVTFSLGGCTDAPLLSVDSVDDLQYQLSWTSPAGTDFLWIQRNDESPDQWEAVPPESTGAGYDTPVDNRDFTVTVWACNEYGCVASDTEEVVIPLRVELRGTVVGGASVIDCGEIWAAPPGGPEPVVAIVYGFIIGETVIETHAPQYPGDSGFSAVPAGVGTGAYVVSWRCGDEDDDDFLPEPRTVVVTLEGTGAKGLTATVTVDVVG